MVIGVPGQEGAEGNVAEKKKVKELKKETTEVKKKEGGVTKLCSLSPQGAYDTEVNAVLQDAPLDEKENPGHHVTFQTDLQYIPPDNKVDDEELACSALETVQVCFLMFLSTFALSINTSCHYIE
ncbi:hypothetical protein Tco_0508952 [Tanacetum coccineum]